MAKYRKRPVIVEAVQWFPGTECKMVVPATFPAIDPAGNEVSVERADMMGVFTPRGFRLVYPGDWVVLENGGHWVSRTRRFTATYEPVEESPGIITAPGTSGTGLTLHEREDESNG